MGIELKEMKTLREFHKSCFSGIVVRRVLKFAERVANKWVEVLYRVVRSRESFFICQWEIFWHVQMLMWMIQLIDDAGVGGVTLGTKSLDGWVREGLENSRDVWVIMRAEKRRLSLHVEIQVEKRKCSSGCFYFLNKIRIKGGLPWWRSGWESACQCRGHGFESRSGKIPYAAERLGLWATITEPARLEPVLHNKRGRDNERPAHRDEGWPPLAATK